MGRADAPGRPVGFAADAPATAHVFVGDIGGDALVIDGDDGHHLQRVRRLRVGEAVSASAGTGWWRLCEVRAVGDGRVVLGPTGPATFEPTLSPRLTVAFAPARGDQAGTVVHQLVELGVDRIMPVTLERSVVRWEGARADRARVKLARIAREAAMQSRRARVPEVLSGEPLEVLARHAGVTVADRDGSPAGSLPAPGAPGWLVLVGPEGGFAPSERERLAAAPRLGLGPHVLRAVTAPVAAAAALAGFRAENPTPAANSSDMGNST